MPGGAETGRWREKMDADRAMAEAVERIYRLVPSHVPDDLIVCFCNCCFDRPTYQELVATPVRALPSALLQEYSNSAHGVPPVEDLLPLLPRYLELIAQGGVVNALSMGLELRRFGEAWLAEPERWPGEIRAALEDWARALIWRECRGLPVDYTYARATRWVRKAGLGARPEVQYGSVYTICMLLIGGLPASVVIEGHMAAFDGPGGDGALACFAEALAAAVPWVDGHPVFDWVPRVDPFPGETRQALADWLNAPGLAERVMRAAGAARDPADAEALAALFDLSGWITADSFLADRRRRQA